MLIMEQQLTLIPNERLNVSIPSIYCYFCLKIILMNQVLIKFDSDIQEAIESNGINIEEYIKRELDCTVSHEDLITDENKEKSKDFYLAVNFVAGSDSKVI